MGKDELVRAAAWAEENATDVARTSPDHGPRHWRDVARVGLAMLQRMGQASVQWWANTPEALFLFAAFHDTQRESEFEDPYHGYRAAAKLMEWDEQENLPTDWSADDLVAISYAMCFHDLGRNNPQHPWAGLSWDADRLTLPRVGIEPEEAYFSSGFIVNAFGLWKDRGYEIVTGPDATWEVIADGYKDLIR